MIFMKNWPGHMLDKAASDPVLLLSSLFKLSSVIRLRYLQYEALSSLFGANSILISLLL
jgi:hypothetical protein